jgi:hypothetical protein
VAAYLDLAHGKRALCFAADVQHTRDLSAAFSAAGVPSGVVLGRPGGNAARGACRHPAPLPGRRPARGGFMWRFARRV